MPLKSPPDGYTAVTPYLTLDDAAAAIDFYVTAFGAVEKFRLPMGDKIGHAEIMIDGAHLMLSDEAPQQGARSPKSLGGASAGIMLYVADVDAVYARAIAAGATSAMAPEDMFWGDRMAGVTDPFGHRWMIATPVEQIAPEEMEKRMAAFSQGGS